MCKKINKALYKIPLQNPNNFCMRAMYLQNKQFNAKVFLPLSQDAAAREFYLHL